MIKKYLIAVIVLLGQINSGFGQSNIIAKQYANQIAVKLMENISPNTGKNSYASISEMEFDYSNNLYIIDMTAHWSACEYLMDCLDSQARMDYWVSCIIKVNSEGKIKSFSKTSAFNKITTSGNTMSNWLVGLSL